MKSSLLCHVGVGMILMTPKISATGHDDTFAEDFFPLEDSARAPTNTFLVS